MAVTPPPRAPLRVLCAIDSLAGGGAERVMAQLANGLDPSRYTVQIALTLDDVQRQELAPRVRVAALARETPAGLDRQRQPPWLRLADHLLAETLRALAPAAHDGGGLAGHARRSAFLRSLRLGAARLGRHTRALAPDCVLSFLPLTNLAALLARRWYGLRVPLLLSDRNYLSREIPGLHWPALHARAVRAYYPEADGHIAVSADAARDLATTFGISPARIATIPNGVDHARLTAAAQASLPVVPEANELRIVCAGRLHPQKGFDVLLAALALLPPRPWRLWLLGEGREEASLRRQAAQLGLAERVDFLGFDANPWRWFARAHLFVSSSRWEGMPNVLLEAMALGLPVVATDCPSGPDEILAHGRWGALVSNESPAALALAIDGLLESPAARATAAALARTRAADYRLEHMVAAYAQLIEAKVAGARRSPA